MADRKKRPTVGHSRWGAIPFRYRAGIVAAPVLAVVLYAMDRNWWAAFVLLLVYFLLLESAWAWKHRRKLAKADLPDPNALQLLAAHWTEERRLYRVQHKWPVICLEKGLTTKLLKAFPRLERIHTTVNGDVKCEVFPEAMGLDSNKIVNDAALIAKSMNAVELRTRRFGNNGLALTFMFSNPLKRVVSVPEMPIAPWRNNSTDPIRLTFSVRPDGTPGYLLSDRSMLIGGVTGSGKSSIMWAILGCLNHLGVPVDLYVSDPKGGMEMRELGEHVGEQLGNLKVRAYADTDADAEKMLKTARDAMSKRQQALKAARIRKHTPTQENPLVIVIIDELLADPKMLKNATTGELGNILSQGRACGYIVMAGTQLAHAADLGTMRNLIPQRVCLRTTSAEVTNTILGPMAEARGALCSQISESDKGVGYTADDEGHQEKFRAVWIGDADRERIAIGLAPEGMGEAEAAQPICQWGVYLLRCWDKQMGYIGKSNEPARRFKEHLATKEWWKFIDPALIQVQWFDTEAEALAQEKYLTEEVFTPIFNKQNNTKNLARVMGWQQLPTVTPIKAVLGRIRRSESAQLATSQPHIREGIHVQDGQVWYVTDRGRYELEHQLKRLGDPVLPEKADDSDGVLAKWTQPALTANPEAWITRAS